MRAQSPGTSPVSPRPLYKSNHNLFSQWHCCNWQPTNHSPVSAAHICNCPGSVSLSFILNMSCLSAQALKIQALQKVKACTAQISQWHTPLNGCKLKKQLNWCFYSLKILPASRQETTEFPLTMQEQKNCHKYDTLPVTSMSQLLINHDRQNKEVSNRQCNQNSCQLSYNTLLS